MEKELSILYKKDQGHIGFASKKVYTTKGKP
jgi:hypothetical protein